MRDEISEVEEANRAGNVNTLEAEMSYRAFLGRWAETLYTTLHETIRRYPNKVFSFLDDTCCYHHR